MNIDTISTQSEQRILQTARLYTKLGPMITIADAKGVYLLEFTDYRYLEREIASLSKKFNAQIVSGESEMINNIEAEIAQYFSGASLEFKTPVHLMGTSFQNSVWEELKKIPAGETRSYLDIAKSLQKPTAFRAVAQANGANPLAIIVPCHRVINSNGALGGYSCGIARKQWLLEHERALPLFRQ